MYDVITIGSITRDVFLKSGDFKVTRGAEFRTGKAGCFMLGTKLEVEDFAVTIGGGGANTAVSFGRKGFKVACVGIVGDDEVGRGIANELKSEGVEPMFQIDKEHQTAYSTVLVASDGERTILEHRGANNFFNKDEVDWSSLQTKWFYIDSLSGDQELLKKIVEHAKENNIKIAFNPGKRLVNLADKLWPFLAQVDLFFVNEDESAIIAGIEYSESNEPEIFKKLDQVVKGVFVMTKGARGICASDNGKQYTAGTPDVAIVDRTGAGDSFGSGFTAGYISSGGDIKYAIELGTANATSVVQHFGATKGLLKKDDWGSAPKVEVIEK